MTAPKDRIELNLRSFESQVMYFNGMYNLPIAKYPTIGALRQPPEQRLEQFKITLAKELSEIDDIIDKIKIAKAAAAQGEVVEYTVTDCLTDIADLLGDIQVYCASEMVKFGIPNKETLRIIMQSNFSKLQLDGTVKYDENGKVLKGPGYWKPEPLIKDMLQHLIDDATNPTPISGVPEK